MFSCYQNCKNCFSATEMKFTKLIITLVFLRVDSDDDHRVIFVGVRKGWQGGERGVREGGGGVICMMIADVTGQVGTHTEESPAVWAGGGCMCQRLGAVFPCLSVTVSSQLELPIKQLFSLSLVIGRDVERHREGGVRVAERENKRDRYRCTE